MKRQYVEDESAQKSCEKGQHPRNKMEEAYLLLQKGIKASS